jgi:flagellar hook-associated protein 2
MLQAYHSMADRNMAKRRAYRRTDGKRNLKKVCGNIVKLNMHMPLYAVDPSKRNLDYAIGVKKLAVALSEKLSQLSDCDSESYQSRVVLVSDTDIMSAALIGENSAELPDELTVLVEALATGQINRGKQLFYPSHWLEPGTYEFTAVIMDQTYPLTFTMKERMNNRDALQSMTDFLNQNISGITAVVDTVKQQYGCIVISSGLSGRYGEKTFYFEESETYREGVVCFFGLNQVEQAAQNAKFVLNGIHRQTATNVFVLEDTLHITLHKTGTVPVMLKFIPDSERVLAVVDETLQTFNGLISLAEQRIHGYGSLKLLNELNRLRRAYAGELKVCGLEFAENGMLRYHVQEAVLAVQNGRLLELFTQENGFFQRLYDQAQKIAINPLDYLDKMILVYPDRKKAVYANPYVISIYSGMMFNSCC